MLIQKLVEYAKAEGLAGADPYFESKPVRWLVEIQPDGSFVQLLRLGDDKRGRDYDVPKKVGGNAGGVATFATDNPRFVLGYTEDAANATKAARDLPAFVALINNAADQDAGNAEFAAARAFYADPPQVAAACAKAAAEKVKDGDRLALSVTTAQNIPIFDSDAGRRFWRSYRKAQDAARKEESAVLCLSCGEVKPPVATSEKLMGVPDGQPSGTALVSFDKDAFQSFGWDQNKNAPVCRDCSFAYTSALNQLLKRGIHEGAGGKAQRTRIDLAGVAYIFWLQSGSAGSFIDDWFEQRDPEEAERVLTAARAGRYPVGTIGDCLYAVGLRGNGGRAVIVDWFEVTLADAYANAVRWFDDLQIRLLFDEKEKGTVFAKAGDLSRPPRLWALGMATAREEKEISPRTPGLLLRAALHGDPLPLAIAEACVRRLVLDPGNFGDFFAPARIGLIRCTLNRRHGDGERKLMPGLDPENHDPAYLCGRLLATLEAIQYAGVGDVGANIVDRFYGKASTAPALVFGPLLTLAQSHLGAIDSDGQRVNLDRELAGILAELDAKFPRTLTLEDQGRFAIGYYHQKAHRFAELRRRKDERATRDGNTALATANEE